MYPVSETSHFYFTEIVQYLKCIELSVYISSFFVQYNGNKLGFAVAEETRKPLRNFRTRPTQRTKTTPAPVAVTSNEDVETSDQCPEPDGYFADAEQCDKYYSCV